MLTLDDTGKRFGPVEALAGCSFAVERGRMLGFLPIGTTERLRFGYMPEERGLYPRLRVGEQLDYFGRLHGLDASAARAAAFDWSPPLLRSS